MVEKGRRAVRQPATKSLETKRRGLSQFFGPNFSAGTIRTMVGEKNGTVPLSADVLSPGSKFANLRKKMEQNKTRAKQWRKK